MSSNEDLIRKKYADGLEDRREEKSRATAQEFFYTKKYLSPYIKKDSRVLELGCGTGYYGMYFADKCLEYTGVDLTPENIEIFNRKISEAGLTNVHAYVGDATKAEDIPSGGYDVVLCLGPMYHLPREERQIVFDNCVNAAKEGAVIAFAYINGLGAYICACMNEKYRNIYPNRKANQCVFEYGTDDTKPGVFFFTSPEEMENDAAAHGLKKIKNAGMDFLLAEGAVNTMSEEQFECWREISDRMSDSESCTGLSNHALLICRK
jgi:2-polyprenyl-3-methyl-5-hydroxy-6-metoxy-1,4-benzoquinol methylase